MSDDEEYLREVSKQLGSLTATIRAIDKRAADQRSARLEIEAKITASLDRIAQRQDEHSLEIEALRTRMDRVEPVAENISGFKAKLTGAMFILGLIGSAILTAMAVFKDQIANAAARLFGG